MRVDGALPGAVAANLMLTAWEQHGSFEGTSPATTRLEQIALRWIRELLALPEGSWVRRSGADYALGGDAGAHWVVAGRDPVMLSAGPLQIPST